MGEAHMTTHNPEIEWFIRCGPAALGERGTASAMLEKLKAGATNGNSGTKGGGRGVQNTWLYAALGIEASLTIDEWKSLIGAFNGECAYCGCRCFPVLEHVIPVSRGGATVIGNVLPSCRSCNAKKRDLDPMVWLARIEPASFVVRFEEAMGRFYGSD